MENKLQFYRLFPKIRDMKKKMLWLFPVLLVVLVGLYAFFIFPGKTPVNPVVLIGLDGADWNIIHPLFERGKLPNLAHLVQEGSWGVLQTMRPTKSPVIWTSIATGKSMIKHGILDYQFVTDNNITIPYSAGERIAKTFWNILSEEGFTVGLINWFVTFPAEAVNGFLVSDRFRIGVYKYLPEDGVTFPNELKDKIFPQVVMFEHKKFKMILREEGMYDYWTDSQAKKKPIPPSRERQVKNFRIYTLQDKSIENTTLFLLENISVDLFATYFRLIDTTSHFASIFIDEELRNVWIKENEELGAPTPETEKRLYQNMATIIEPVYSYMDRVVGRIINKSPENAIFILVSDHGFNFSSKGYAHYDTPSIAHGVFAIKGPGVKPGNRLEQVNIFDITPTLLYLFGLPAGEDMDGRVLVEAFQDDFNKSRKVRFIPSYGASSRSEEAKKPRELDKEVLEDLRSLGYIK
jgi:predicted AlkP superfamily phosphohydrolase/phosphomutase